MALRIVIAGLVLSVLANVFLLVRGIDQGISLTYARASVDYLQGTARSSLRIIQMLTLSMDRSSIERLSEALSSQGEIVKSTPNGIEIGDYMFEIKDQQVTSVEFREGAVEFK